MDRSDQPDPPDRIDRIVAVAHLPHLPLAVAPRAKPGANAVGSVVVVDEEVPDRVFLPKSIHRIVDADEALWDRRVLPGLRLVDAQRIAPALSTVVVTRGRINEALAALAELLLVHSPIVEPLPSVMSGPSIALDLTGLLRAPSEILKDIEQTLKDAGHVAVVVASPLKRLSLALAVDAARAPGRYRRRTRFSVDAANVARARERIGIASLGIDLPTLEVFEDLGVKTAGDLRRLIPGGAAARLVDDARAVLRLFDAAIEDPLSPLRPPEHIVERVDLDDAVSFLEALRFVLSPLCDRAIQRALVRGLKVAGVVVEFSGRDLPIEKANFAISLEFPEPLFESRALLTALGTRLEQTGVPGPVERVTLRVTRLSAGRRRQQDAFRIDDAAPAALGALLAELATELGPDCAGCLRVTRALLPEEMSRLSWPVPPKPPKVGVDLDDVAADGRFLAGWPWPVRLLREPRLLADVDDASEKAAVRDVDKRLAFGRLEGEDGGAIPFLRDYQVLVLKDGRWLFTWRDPETGDEHLQGLFD